MPHDFHPTSLREYDIRGIIGETLGEADAYAIGRSFGTRIARSGGSKVAVGYDGRTSSPGLEAALVKGLNESGVEALRIGLGPTPMLYYAVHELGCDGGVMITGSHNPPNYNGFKMMLGQGPFFGADIQALGRAAAAGDWDEGAGTSQQVEIMDRYVDRLLRNFEGSAFTIAWDCGNGVAGPVVEKLVKRLPGTHYPMFTDVDGAFPNHHPDPTDETNLVDLKRVVAEKGCDFGVAFDGDGDRIGAVDGQGRVIWGDQLLSIFAVPVLKAVPGGTIIADVKASQMLFDRVAELGGTPLMWKTGHSPDQGQDEGSELPAGGRDERPRVLPARLVRLRRRDLFGDSPDLRGQHDGRVADRAQGRDAGADQHAGTALPVVGRAQIRRRRGGAGAPEGGQRPT